MKDLGPENVLKAFKLFLLNVNKPVELDLIGAFSTFGLKKKFHDNVLELDLYDQVNLIDHMPRNELYDRLSEYNYGICYLPVLDVFEQNSPIKLLEYIAAGLQVVSTPQNLNAKIIQGTSLGVISKSDGVKDFAEAMYEATILGYIPADANSVLKDYDCKLIRKKLLEFIVKSTEG